jgi:hypothetical protein
MRTWFLYFEKHKINLQIMWIYIFLIASLHLRFSLHHNSQRHMVNQMNILTLLQIMLPGIDCPCSIMCFMFIHMLWQRNVNKPKNLVRCGAACTLFGWIFIQKLQRNEILRFFTFEGFHRLRAWELGPLLLDFLACLHHFSP